MKKTTNRTPRVACQGGCGREVSSNERLCWTCFEVSTRADRRKARYQVYIKTPGSIRGQWLTGCDLFSDARAEALAEVAPTQVVDIQTGRSYDYGF